MSPAAANLLAFMQTRALRRGAFQGKIIRARRRLDQVRIRYGLVDIRREIDRQNEQLRVVRNAPEISVRE